MTCFLVAKCSGILNAELGISVIASCIEVAQACVQSRVDQPLVESDIGMADALSMNEDDAFDQLFGPFAEMVQAICCSIVSEIAIWVEFQRDQVSRWAEEVTLRDSIM